MEVRIQPDVTRLLQGPDDIHQGGEEGLHFVV